MTSIQEQNLLRIAAWVRYQASKTALLVCKSKLQGFREPYRILVVKLLDGPLGISEHDVPAVPSRDSLLDAVEKFKAVANDYQNAVDETRHFGWPVLGEYHRV